MLARCRTSNLHVYLLRGLYSSKQFCEDCGDPGNMKQTVNDASYVCDVLFVIINVENQRCWSIWISFVLANTIRSKKETTRNIKDEIFEATEHVSAASPPPKFVRRSCELFPPDRRPGNTVPLETVNSEPWFQMTSDRYSEAVSPPVWAITYTSRNACPQNAFYSTDLL